MWKKNNDSIKWLALPLSPSNSRLIQFLKLISCLMWLELRGKWLLFRICIVFFFLFTCIIFIFFIFICFIFFINSNINIGTSIGNSTTTSTSNNTCSNSNTSSKANLFPRTSPVLEKKGAAGPLCCAPPSSRKANKRGVGWQDPLGYKTTVWERTWSSQIPDYFKWIQHLWLAEQHPLHVLKDI